MSMNKAIYVNIQLNCECVFMIICPNLVKALVFKTLQHAPPIEYPIKFLSVRILSLSVTVTLTTFRGL
jgi:hypothetical protein